MPTATPNGRAAPTKRQAVILAGGRSARFGRDKALMPVGAQSMLARTAGTLTAAGFAVAVSTSHQTHAHCGYPVIWDDAPLHGPLYALRTICEHFPQTALFVTACDTPFLTASLADWLWTQRGDHPVTVLATGQGASPLPGMYHTALLPTIQACLTRNEQSLHALLRATPQRQIIPQRQWQSIDPDGWALINLNTPDDLATACRNVFCDGTGTTD